MSAIRLARGFTGRSKIIKFAGCYHGHVDALLASAGSGVATFALPDSAGVTAGTTAEVIVLPYNDIDAVRAAFAGASGRDRRGHHRGRRGEHGRGPAGAGVQRRRSPQIAHADGALLISDEVMTGFRVSRSGMYGLDARRRGLAAGPDDVRQGDRRRAAGRRVRRPRRHHGAARPDRAGVPGRHAVREPGRHRRRPGDPAAAATTRCTATSTRPPAPSGDLVSAALTQAGVPHRLQRAGQPVLGLLRRRPGPRTTTRRAAQSTAAYAAFFHAHAGRRRVPAAVGLRGLVRLGRPRRRGARADRRALPAAARAAAAAS